MLLIYMEMFKQLNEICVLCSQDEFHRTQPSVLNVHPLNVITNYGMQFVCDRHLRQASATGQMISNTSGSGTRFTRFTRIRPSVKNCDC